MYIYIHYTHDICVYMHMCVYRGAKRKTIYNFMRKYGVIGGFAIMPLIKIITTAFAHLNKY